MTELSVFPALSRDPSLAERVSVALMESIMSGRLVPGDRLPSERALCEQFGVSRTVVREAVRGLQARGVLRVRSGLGAEVVAVPASHITETLALFMRGANDQDLLGAEHLSEVRETLEVKLVELACLRATEEDLAGLAQAVAAMAEAANVEEASRHDVDFHRRIAKATKNVLFVVLLDSIGDVLMEIRRSSLAVEGRRDKALDEHRRVLVALEQRDVDAARTAMADHLEGSRAYYLAAVH